MTRQDKRAETRRYGLFPSVLAGNAESAIGRALKRRGFPHDALLHYWPLAAGPVLSTYAQPVRLSRRNYKEKTTHTLVVKCHAGYSTILAHQSEEILTQLTQYLGYRPAERMKIVQ